MSDPKMEKDFSKEVDDAIPKAYNLAKEGQLERAIDNLLVIEKQSRTAGDAASTGKILVCVVNMCYEAKNFKALKENILMLNKRRAQLRSAISKMVDRAMEILDELDYEQMLELLNTLISVTEGKIFVEKQRAQLSLKLAGIREKEGKVVEAAQILLAIQVETFGSMDKKEKTEFLLEQMRLCLAKKDYIRTQIISRKVPEKVFEIESCAPLKIKFHQLMVEYYSHSDEYLSIFKSYHSILRTPSIQQDEEQLKLYLKLCTAYIILSPHSNEQCDLLNKLYVEKSMNIVPEYKALIKKYLTAEVLVWSDLFSSIESEFSHSLAPFSKSSTDASLVSSTSMAIDSKHLTGAQKLWRDMSIRTTEHNIRVIAAYYSQISMEKLATLLSLPADEAEKHLSHQVTSKNIWARIDRISRIVNFVKPQKPADTLNEWSSDISSLLTLVEKTCHMIQRENMVHANRKAAQIASNSSNAMEQ